PAGDAARRDHERAPGRDLRHLARGDRLSAPPGNTCPLLARDHAAPGTTLALAKAPSLGRGRVRPLAWCSRPTSSTALPDGALEFERLARDLDLVAPLGPRFQQRRLELLVAGRSANDAKGAVGPQDAEAPAWIRLRAVDQEVRQAGFVRRRIHLLGNEAEEGSP